MGEALRKDVDIGWSYVWDETVCVVEEASGFERCESVGVMVEGDVLVLVMMRWGFGCSADPASRFFRLQRWRHRSISIEAKVRPLFDTLYCTTRGSKVQLGFRLFYMRTVETG